MLQDHEAKRGAEPHAESALIADQPAGIKQLLSDPPNEAKRGAKPQAAIG